MRTIKESIQMTDYSEKRKYSKEEREQRSGWFMCPGKKAHFYIKDASGPACGESLDEVPYYQRPMWDYDHCQACRDGARKYLKKKIEEGADKYAK